MTTFLVRCAEVGREQQARHGALRRDLAAVIRARWPAARVEASPGRLIVEADARAEDLAAISGVIDVAPCRRVARADLERAVLELARGLAPGRTFAVKVRRAGNHDHDRDGTPAAAPPGSTLALAARLGGAVSAATGAIVDLACPDVTLGVELRDGHALVFDRVVDGVDRTGPAAPTASAPGEPRFLADQMLGRLATWLRLLGFDTATAHGVPDSAVVRQATAEGRVLLTRDAALARSRAVRVHRVVARDHRAQLVEVLAAFALAPDPARLFTRCTRDNAPIVPVVEDAVAGGLPPGVLGRGLAFYRCPACQRIYWRGDHVDRILRELAQLAGPGAL